MTTSSPRPASARVNARPRKPEPPAMITFIAGDYGRAGSFRVPRSSFRVPCGVPTGERNGERGTGNADVLLHNPYIPAERAELERAAAAARERAAHAAVPAAVHGPQR